MQASTDSKSIVTGMQNRVIVSAGSLHTIGLGQDGTMLATGYNRYNQCDVVSWKDIVSVSAGNMHTAGLRKDGTVVAVGYNNYKQCDVASWKDIKAIETGDNHTLGVTYSHHLR